MFSNELLHMDTPLPLANLHVLCMDTGYSLDDLSGAMNDRIVRELCVIGTTWW